MTDNKLELILKGEEQDDLFSKLKITKYAFEKLNAYAQLILTSKDPLECYGYLLADKSNNELITDVYLPKQTVSHVSCDVTIDGKRDFNEFIKNSNYTLVGWWHSHADFDTFHSSKDERNMKKRLSFSSKRKNTGFLKTNLLSGKLKFKPIEKDDKRFIEIKSANSEISDKIVMELDKDTKLVNFDVNNVYVEKPHGFDYFSSIVVNKDMKHYVEVITKNNLTKKESKINPTLELYKDNQNNLDYYALFKDIQSSISINGRNFDSRLNSRDIGTIEKKIVQYLSTFNLGTYVPPQRTDNGYVDKISDPIPVKTKIVEKPVEKIIEKIVEKPVKEIIEKQVMVVDDKKIISLEGKLTALQQELNMSNKENKRLISKNEEKENEIKSYKSDEKRYLNKISSLGKRNTKLENKLAKTITSYEKTIYEVEKEKTILEQKITQYEKEKQIKKTKFVKKVEEPIKKTPKIIKKEPVKKITEIYKTNITKKENLEEKVGTEPIVNTQNQEITTGNGYYNRITNYSTSLESSVLKDVSEILSGDHRDNGKRTWEWKQRQKEIKKYYKINKVEYSNNDKQKIEEIIDIVESNKYATKNHRRKINNICETIKYKGESKLKRFFKRNWKKVAAGLVTAVAVGSYFGVKVYNNSQVQPFSDTVETNVEYVAKEDVSQPITVDSVVTIDEQGKNIEIISESVSSAIQSKNETYIVQKGDCLWNIAKKYVREQGIRPNNRIVAEVTNKIAKDNGKAGLGEYKGLERRDMRNPNLIHPNENIEISKEVKDYIQQYKTKR